MGDLNEFSEMVTKLTDSEMLSAAEGIMNDLAAISNLKQKIGLIEDGLHDGKRAAFYFFTMNLTDDEITLAAQTVKGRIRFLAEKAQREADANPVESEE